MSSPCRTGEVPDATTTVVRERVLLICPPVFTYHRSIQSELERQGFAVTWWDDRGSPSSLDKAGLRLLPEAFASRMTPTFRRRLAELDRTSVTRVLAVKGEGMSVDFIRLLRSELPRARLSLYFWDSVDNAPRARTIAPLFDSVATFDPADAAELGWSYRPLFARSESISLVSPDRPVRYDWCFIGTLHSDRYSVAQRLRRAAPELRSFFFGFVPSRTLLLARHLTDWQVWKAPRGSVSTKMMAAQEVAAIASASRAMLDIEHPRQRGLTMRTIETLLSGRKLITTNRHMLHSDLYDPSRVHVIARERPDVPREFLELPFKPLDAAVRSRYSLDRWIVDLIGDVPA